MSGNNHHRPEFKAATGTAPMTSAGKGLENWVENTK